MKTPFYMMLSSIALLLTLQGCGGGSAKKTDLDTKSINQKPVVTVETSKSRVVEDESVIFDASKSYDPDGKIIKYVWKDVDGRILYTGPKLNRVFEEPGEYTMILEVVDDKGNITRKTVRCSVNKAIAPTSTTPPTQPENQPPVVDVNIIEPANAEDNATISIVSGDTVHFSGADSYDPEDGTITKYEWRNKDCILLSDEVKFHQIFYYNHCCKKTDEDGRHYTEYKIKLCVFDSEGEKSCKTIRIRVYEPETPQAPTVTIQATPGTRIMYGTPLTLEALVTDPDSDVGANTYIWRDEHGNIVGSSNPITLNNLPYGPHTFTVTVTDSDGNETTVSIDIFVTLTGVSGG